MEKPDDPKSHQLQIRELASQVAQDRLAPRASERDKNGSFPREAVGRLGEAGLAGVIILEENGGAGAERTCFASVVEELARGCASTALMWSLQKL